MTLCCRNIALVIILIRAGLDLDPHALKRLKFTVLKLGLGPWFVEMITVGILALYLLELPLNWALLLGCIVAAVSPAVVVPCLFRLRNKGDCFYSIMYVLNLGIMPKVQRRIR